MNLGLMLVTGGLVMCIFSFIAGFVFCELIRDKDDGKMKFSKRMTK